MKIYVQYETKMGAYGGANQFIKALEKYFNLHGVCTTKPSEADIILFNSSNYPYETIKKKKKYPETIFVHRMDGPCKLYNCLEDVRDDIAYKMNSYIADATIFQSEYSKKESKKGGIERNTFETVISNAPDASVFYRKEYDERSNRKKRIIMTSFSSNMKKGFAVYKYIDDNLDFKKYEVIFVGNSPITFKNIKNLGVMDSQKLANELRRSDLYITASQKDPCSNSLIEAMSCGLPVVALNDGGHPELVLEGGELFNTKEEVIPLINKIFENYENYIGKIKITNFDEIGKTYLKYFEYLIANCKTPKKINVKEIKYLKKYFSMCGVVDPMSVKSLLRTCRSKVYEYLLDKGFIKQRKM